MHRRLAVVWTAGLLVVGCGGEGPPPPLAEQLQAAIQGVVTSVDATARVALCSGPPEGGHGRYICPVRWPRGGGPAAFQVRVDAHGGWKTADLPYGAGSGGQTIGEIRGRGLRLR